MTLRGVWRAGVLLAVLGGCGDPPTSSDPLSMITPVTQSEGTLCEQAAEIFAFCLQATGTSDTGGNTYVFTCEPGSLEACQSQCAIDNFDGECESLLDLDDGADYFACVAGCAG